MLGVLVDEGFRGTWMLAAGLRRLARRVFVAAAGRALGTLARRSLVGDR
jgi:hypothetical protein